MSYSGRVRYKTMREKNAQNKKRFKAILLALVIALIFYLIFNWVSVKDYIATYFY